jgi:intracellular sulfur oxidation DsrE/DsrF family protein
MMLRFVTMILALAFATASGPALSAATEGAAATSAKVGCASPEAAAATNAAAQPAAARAQGCTSDGAVPKVVFKLNTAEDAPTILRFVTNYLAVEPNARVAVVGYGGGIDFMLEGARDASGKPYADQIAALADRGVAFKVCNNTLKARNLTASAVSPMASVVPGAVNEIIRLQTKEGYAYFQN